MKTIAKSAAQAAVKAKKRDYTYTEFSKLKVSHEPVNIYGVVLDATFPHKSFNSNKYLCAFKVADLTSKTTDGTVEYISVVFFASRFEDLPISQRVGEIIRIHRAVVGVYKDKLQLTVNICFNSSWALFAPSFPKKTEDGKVQKASIEDYVPLTFYGKSMHTEAKDKLIVSNLRTWSSKQFASIPVLQGKYITKLSEVPIKGSAQPDGKFYDFDLQVKIVQLFKIDDFQSEIRVLDESGEIWHSQIFNVKYRWIKEGQYVRIRGATLANHPGYERTFGMRPYTNILSLPYPCKLASNMLFDEQTDT